MIQGLRADERGAILVIGVFMAAFMAAVLFHGVEMGNAVYLRERLQDGADAGAFSAATTYARAMNVVVLANLIMAALLAVLVALRVVELLATLAIAILAALSWFGGVTAAAIPPVQAVRQTVQELHESLKEPVYSALSVLHTTAEVLGTVVPDAAESTALEISAEYGPEVSFAFAVPSLAGLPVENDAFDLLCGESGSFVADLAFKQVGVFPDAAADGVRGAVEDLATSASDWFCGKSGSSAPSLTRRVRVVLPRLPEREACEEHVADRDDPDDPGPCADVDAIEARGMPDEEGSCRTDCGLGGSYDTRVRLAREQCNPGAHPERQLTGFWWQQQNVRVLIEKRDGDWVQIGRTPVGAPVLVQKGKDDTTRPCGGEDALYSFAWNSELHPRNSYETLPVCKEPWSPPEWGSGPVAVEVTEVVNVLRCSYTELRNIASGTEFDEDKDRQEVASESDDYSPQRVIEGVALGGEAFMVRVVSVPPRSAGARNPATIALWGEATDAPEPGVTPFALAQAEYFYDGADGRDGWMWRMSWRARLRRVQWPESDGQDELTASSFAAACRARMAPEGGACPPMSEVRRLVPWMVH